MAWFYLKAILDEYLIRVYVLRSPLIFKSEKQCQIKDE